MLTLLVSFALAGERSIDPSALPAPVTAAVAARVPGAAITAASREGSEYEVNVSLGERRLELAFKADGTWLEEEEVVSVEALPAAVKATLAARWEGATIGRAERSTTAKGTTWEVIVTKAGKSNEVAMDDVGVVKRTETVDKNED